MTRSLAGLVGAIALVAACTETLRVPSGMDDTGAAGASASSATGYAIAPPATGGGLVGGTSAAGASGMSSGGPGAGGTVGTPQGGTAAMIGSAGMATVFGTVPSAPWLPEGAGRYADLDAAPIGMSRDGTAVLESNGLVWMGKGSGPAIVEQSLFGSPEALSSDGTTVVGESPVLVTGCGSISRWTASEVEALGMVFLGSGSFVSGDGTAIAGTTSGPTCANGPTNAFFWRPGNLMVLPQIGGLQDAAALGLSDDGSTVIGRAWTPPSDAGPLFRFSSATGVTTLGSPNGTVTSPVFTSASGSAFAGTAHDQSGNAFGFAWTVGSGFTALPKVPARGQSLVFGLSADGTVVLGLGTNAPGSPLLIAQDGFPFTWTAGGGLILLQGLMPGMIFESIVMAADASSIVGNLAPVTMGPPVIWDANRKPRSLFTDAPMFLARCRPVVRYVSADAKTFAGACDATGRKRGFVARF